MLRGIKSNSFAVLDVFKADFEAFLGKLVTVKSRKRFNLFFCSIVTLTIWHFFSKASTLDQFLFS